MRRGKTIVLMAVLGVFLCNLVYAQPARIVSVRPDTRLIKDAEKKVAGIAMPVPDGTTLETDENGKASLLLPDQMLLKVDHNTVFTYQGASAEQGNGELLKGNVWLRGQKRGQAFRVRTPSATAAIRGTEWYMSVNPGGETTVGVMDGSVAVSNELGQVVLASREVGVTLRKRLDGRRGLGSGGAEEREEGDAGRKAGSEQDEPSELHVTILPIESSMAPPGTPARAARVSPPSR